MFFENLFSKSVTVFGPSSYFEDLVTTFGDVVTVFGKLVTSFASKPVSGTSKQVLELCLTPSVGFSQEAVNLRF